MQIYVNYLAVFISAVASMVIGSVWYGPLFGKIFMREMGMDTWSQEKKDAEKKKMGKAYTIQFVASLIMFFVLAVFMDKLDLMSISGGVKVALMGWLGFVVPVKLGDAIWGGKISLFWLGAGNMLLTLVAAGVILGAWS